VDPEAAATNFIPSSDEATETQFVLGASAFVHVAAEFVEV
jgi:hypothetical protein